MSPKSFVAPILLAASLAACSSQTPPPASTPEPAPEASAEPTSCGAEQFASYVGQKGTDDVIAAIQAKRGDQPIRVIKPGMAVTMDYRAERLNVDLDDSGTITRFYCS
ncbi:I78 family peptidase inhibitor [Novosphingobium kaempferiae]|uniref:I78 family peptidase inhibitor n=1 Tax=Novosphingobium kaempferiae TaxID=2896849 RepID=UPI001E3C983C|nr:I78 family peptidase inhibitor [Novosphingobium kaempferiae]